jgi:NADPH:quinone reductase-like Zn-dependent oxidoreductase
VAAGQRVLINGAGGGAGSFAIQLAKRAGAQVTGVDNAGKLQFMVSLGADQVIDYAGEDFTRPAEPYDLVLDLVAHHSPFACRRALAPRGRYCCVGGPVRTLVAIMTIGSIIGGVTRRRLGVLVVAQGPMRFTPLTDLGVAGDIGIPIDRRFGLDDVPQALRYLGEGLAHGKLAVTTDCVPSSEPTATVRSKPRDEGPS